VRRRQEKNDNSPGRVGANEGESPVSMAEKGEKGEREAWGEAETCVVSCRAKREEERKRGKKKKRERGAVSSLSLSSPIYYSPLISQSLLALILIVWRVGDHDPLLSYTAPPVAPTSRTA